MPLGEQLGASFHSHFGSLIWHFSIGWMQACHHRYCAKTLRKQQRACAKTPTRATESTPKPLTSNRDCARKFHTSNRTRLRKLHTSNRECARKPHTSNREHARNPHKQQRTCAKPPHKQQRAHAETSHKQQRARAKTNTSNRDRAREPHTSNRECAKTHSDISRAPRCLEYPPGIPSPIQSIPPGQQSLLLQPHTAAHPPAYIFGPKHDPNHQKYKIELRWFRSSGQGWAFYLLLKSPEPLVHTCPHMSIPLGRLPLLLQHTAATHLHTSPIM